MFVVVYLDKGKITEIVGENEKPTKEFDNWVSGKGKTRGEAVKDALASLDAQAVDA